jgi:phytanoyl-CoA hydroxylase
MSRVDAATFHAEYLRDGYYVARQLFTKEEINCMRDVFMEMGRNGPVPELSDSGSTDPADPLSFYPRMMQPHMFEHLPVGPLAWKYMFDERLHPYLSTFLKDEPVAVQSMFYFKPPKARGQELHQDNFYLRVKPGTCMAAWIAVDAADEENGGMKVVPGSHEMAIACPEPADPATSFTTEYVAPPEGMAAVHVDLAAGDVLFFNGSLIHGSSPNTSSTRFRRSLIFHYIPLGAEEVGDWYGKSMMTFSGQKVEAAHATGAGPCGTNQPAARH